MNTKNQFFGLLIVVIMAALTSCEGLMDQFGITLNSDVYEVERTIEPQPAGEYEYEENAIASDIDAFLEENGRTLEEVKSVNLKMVSLEVVDEGKNFEAFDAFEFVLSAGGAEEVVVAHIENIPDTANFLNLNLSTIDVATYITADEFNLKLISVQDKDLTEAITILGKVKFGINFGFDNENE